MDKNKIITACKARGEHIGDYGSREYESKIGLDGYFTVYELYAIAEKMSRVHAGLEKEV